MASFVFQSIADVFPVGTTVGAYVPPSNPEANAPAGSPVTTAVVASDGTLSFAGLSDDTTYVAYESGTGHSRRFRTLPLVVGSDRAGTDAQRDAYVATLSTGTEWTWTLTDGAGTMLDLQSGVK